MRSLTHDTSYLFYIDQSKNLKIKACLKNVRNELKLSNSKFLFIGNRVSRLIRRSSVIICDNVGLCRVTAAASTTETKGNHEPKITADVGSGIHAHVW